MRKIAGEPIRRAPPPRPVHFLALEFQHRHRHVGEVVLPDSDEVAAADIVPVTQEVGRAELSFGEYPLAPGAQYVVGEGDPACNVITRQERPLPRDPGQRQWGLRSPCWGSRSRVLRGEFSPPFESLAEDIVERPESSGNMALRQRNCGVIHEMTPRTACVPKKWVRDSREELIRELQDSRKRASRNKQT